MVVREHHASRAKFEGAMEKWPEARVQARASAAGDGFVGYVSAVAVGEDREENLVTLVRKDGSQIAAQRWRGRIDIAPPEPLALPPDDQRLGGENGTADPGVLAQLCVDGLGRGREKAVERAESADQPLGNRLRAVSRNRRERCSDCRTARCRRYAVMAIPPQIKAICSHDGARIMIA